MKLGFMIEQSPLVLAYITDDGKDKMIAGEAALAVVYSGDAMETMWENEDLHTLFQWKAQIYG